MLKKGLMLVWCALLVSMSIVPSTSAASDETLQITVNTMPKVDVSLALGVTNDDGVRFKDDLTRLLKERGLDPSVVSIQALESRDEQTFQGKFKMQVYWDNNGTDMDSHTVFKQNGAQISQMYFGARNVFGSTLDTDDTSGGRGEWSTIDFDGVPPNVDEIAFEVNPWRGAAYTTVKLFREQNGVQEQLINAPQWVGLNGTHIRVNFGSFRRNGKGGWDFRYAATGQIFEGSKTVVTAKAFTEVLREPVWRDESTRFIVNMNNDKISDFDSPTALGEILTRLTNENINYIGVGSNTNQAQSQSFIQKNDNRGAFINSNTRNYTQYMNDIADYIREQVRLQQTSGSSQYALVNQQIDMQVIPREFATNTETVLFPTGRWRMDHDETYFQNGNGRYAKSGIYQPNLDFTLDKIGRYELWFGDLHPEPRYLFIHRKPVASYRLDVRPSGSNRLVSVQDLSYDLDGQTPSDDGLSQREWKWKKTTDTTWTNGLIPSTLPAGNDYIVQLRVKDYQEQWSDAVAHYITTNSQVTSKPIASFDLPYESLVYNPVAVRDISYDPSGRAITAREWTVTNADTGAVVHTGSTPLTNFAALGKGKYTYALRVRNDANLWSETFKRNISVVVDNVAPTIDINKRDHDWTNQDIGVAATFEDRGGSGFKDQRFAVTTSTATPGSWSAWGTGTRRDISITAQGVHYIHLQARDNEGNVATTVYGPYKIDKTLPTLSVTGNLVNPTHDDVQLTINAGDSLSGLALVDVDGTQIPLNNLTYIVKNKGTHRFTVTDKAGNKMEMDIHVQNIDKDISMIGPTIGDIGPVTIAKDIQTVRTDVSKVTVKDWRDGSNSWRLDVSATPFVSVQNENDVLDADIKLKGVDAVRKTTGAGAVPVSTGTGARSIRSTTQSLVTASGARGEYDMTFPADAFEVVIDPTKVKKGAYQSVVTWSIIDAPH